MITCPNCNHQNPDGALQCEACYTPLPAMVSCPNCGTPVQENASFCGQCGYDLRELNSSSAVSSGLSSSTPSASETPSGSGSTASTEVSAFPESALPTQNFLTENEASAASAAPNSSDFELPDLTAPDPAVVPEPIAATPVVPEASEPANQSANQSASQSANQSASQAPTAPISPPPPAPAARPATTQLQVITARLRHAQTDTPIEIPSQLSVVRIGKPNNQTPPDIDVSGFSDSDIVSRVHANLRVEGDVYYLEDVGSSNGTYINGMPLPMGNRHRLRAGDRIALGKGDKVSFIFETT